MRYTDQVDNDLSGTVIIDDLEVTNVTVLLHTLEELHDDLGGRLQENLTLSTLFGVDDGVQRITENTDANHVCYDLFR